MIFIWVNLDHPCHYKPICLEKYHYNLSNSNDTIINLLQLKICHYLPLQCTKFIFWTKLPLIIYQHAADEEKPLCRDELSSIR